MSNPTPNWVKGLFVGIGGLATATITILTVFKIVDWSAAQTALVGTETGAVLGFVAAFTVHFMPSTAKEPVALAATFTAALSATLALGTGFSWWHLSSEQISALVALVSAVIGTGTALIARHNVTAS